MHGCSPAPSCFLYRVSARAGKGQSGIPTDGILRGETLFPRRGMRGSGGAEQGRACCPSGDAPDPRCAPGGCAALPGRSDGDKGAAAAGRGRGWRAGGGAGALRPGGRKTGRGVRGGERGGRLGPAEKEGSPGGPHPRSCPAGVPQHGAVLAELAGQRGEQAPLPGRGGPGGVPSAGLTRGGGSGGAGGRWQAAGPARGASSRRGAGVPGQDGRAGCAPCAAGRDGCTPLPRPGTLPASLPCRARTRCACACSLLGSLWESLGEKMQLLGGQVLSSFVSLLFLFFIIL